MIGILKGIYKIINDVYDVFNMSKSERKCKCLFSGSEHYESR
jgi:hypothetical protein